VFQRTKSLLGVDLGSQAIKAVELTMDGSEAVLTGFARAEVAPGEDRSRALETLLEGAGFRSRRVVTALAGQSVVVRYISMVRMSDSELDQAIRFESDKYLPFDADESVLDCQRLQRASGGNRSESTDEQMGVVLAACRASDIEHQLEGVVARGLTPVAVDVEVFALANAWEFAGEHLKAPSGQTSERVFALVDVGARRSQVNVLAQGETCFSREIGMGGQDMTQAAARRLGMELHEAEQLKRAPEGREAELTRAIAPVLEDLVGEISLSLDYVENREGLHVDELLLSGGGALAPGTVEFMQKALGRPTRLWSPVSGLRVDTERVDLELLEEAAASLTVAVGLASRVVKA